MGSRFNELADVAWMCLDINSRVLSAMPIYRTIAGSPVEPMAWMTNPDDAIYSSWNEFAKQLFWDYLTGEVFVMAMTRFSNGFPMSFRVVPPWMVDAEIRQGRRQYRLFGSMIDVTDDILHIRYKGTTDKARGVGPLDSAGGRMLTAGILARYVRDVAQTGGDAGQTLETDQDLTREDAQDLANQWIESRIKNAPHPPILDRNVRLEDHKTMSPRDMALLEIAQFTEARIAGLLGVPPFLAGLPATGGGDGESMTYSNVGQIFEYHDRLSLRTFASDVMAALSGWALPRGQAVELNRDEYSRPSFGDRAEAWVKLVDAGIVTVDEVRRAERLTGEASAAVLSGATLDGSEV
jgi:HK97 family phage portal protein